MLANHLLIRQAVNTVKFNRLRTYTDRHRRLKQHCNVVYEVDANNSEVIAHHVLHAIISRGYENPIKCTISRTGRHYIRILAQQAKWENGKYVM